MLHKYLLSSPCKDCLSMPQQAAEKKVGRLLSLQCGQHIITYHYSHPEADPTPRPGPPVLPAVVPAAQKNAWIPLKQYTMSCLCSFLPYPIQSCLANLMRMQGPRPAHSLMRQRPQQAV
jgi:hypothetical protein